MFAFPARLQMNQQHPRSFVDLVELEMTQLGLVLLQGAKALAPPVRVSASLLRSDPRDHGAAVATAETLRGNRWVSR